MDSRDVTAFYDGYVERQALVGTNARHRAILSWAKRFGLQEGDRVLEIGAGIGTVTRLLSDAVGPRGRVLGVDLSPRSIAMARERLAMSGNVELVAADILHAELEGQFDVIVMPDVIEHIPLELHLALFERVAAWLACHGFVLLHYPNPNLLAWCHEHVPELLQIVDQPICADVLLANVYPNGLYLDHLETYSIWIHEGDYVVAVLRSVAAQQTFTHVAERGPSLRTRIAARIRRWVREADQRAYRMTDTVGREACLHRIGAPRP